MELLNQLVEKLCAEYDTLDKEDVEYMPLPDRMYHDGKAKGLWLAIQILNNYKDELNDRQTV